MRQGLELNYRVTAFVRDDKVLLDDPAFRKNQNLLIVRGSPTCQADLDRCVEGQDVVINVIGVGDILFASCDAMFSRAPCTKTKVLFVGSSFGRRPNHWLPFASHSHQLHEETW